MTQNKTKVLVLGGGFGGIKAALELSKTNNVQVSLISDRKDFRYYPALYRTATGASKNASSIPLEEIFNELAVKLINEEVVKIDRENKTVITKAGNKYSFDKLIIALGVVTNYFGIKGLKEFSYGIKTNQEAAELRKHLHKLIADEGKPDLNYIVIGGGPTGVELAGALPEYLKHIMKKHGVQSKKIHIDLVEASPRLLPRMTKQYSRSVEIRLRKLGVTLMLNKKVEAENAESLMVSGHSIESHTVIWTAGVTNHPFFKANNFTLSEHGKVVVNSFLEAEDSIYVIGDNADTPYSGMAQTALYDAVFAAKNIKRVAAGKTQKSYKPKKPVYITPAGDGWSAVSWGKLTVFGLSGWLLRNVADFAAFHDFEPWWKSSQHFIAEFEHDSDCRKCL